MPRQLLLPIAEEIRTELLVHEIVERVETRIRRVIADDLPQAMAACHPTFAEQISESSAAAELLPQDVSSPTKQVRDEQCDKRTKRSGLSGDDLRDALDELRQFAETIDHQVKCLRTDIIHFAQFIHRPWEDDIDEADWWKRGGADDESNYQQKVSVFHSRMMFDTMHDAILYAPV